MGGFSSSEKMTGVFSYESSYLDWCEANYRHSEHIVEYFNTMSSLFFFVISPIMLYLLHPYARERNLAVHLVWIMMIFVGLFSPYFHMTLSFMGQMLDELSILWVLGLCYTLVPTQAIPTQAIPLLHQGQDDFLPAGHGDHCCHHPVLLCQTHCQRLRPQLLCLPHLLIGSGDEDLY